MRRVPRSGDGSRPSGQAAGLSQSPSVPVRFRQPAVSGVFVWVGRLFQPARGGHFVDLRPRVALVVPVNHSRDGARDDDFAGFGFAQTERMKVGAKSGHGVGMAIVGRNETASEGEILRGCR